MTEKRDRRDMASMRNEGSAQPGIRECAVQGTGRGWTLVESTMSHGGCSWIAETHPVAASPYHGCAQLAASPASTYAPRLPHPGQCDRVEERKSEDVEGELSMDD